MNERKTQTILDKMTPCDKERFWSKVDIKSEEECWNWKDSLDKSGHARMSVGGRDGEKLSVHRIAKTLSIGEELPDDKVVMHTCDNPPCCNPNHLELGTQIDNIADMVEKNRSAISFGFAKVDWDIVDNIRSSDLSGKDLSNKYKLAKSTVSEIRNNKIWKEEHRDVAHIPKDIDVYQLIVDDNNVWMVI